MQTKELGNWDWPHGLQFEDYTTCESALEVWGIKNVNQMSDHHLTRPEEQQQQHSWMPWKDWRQPESMRQLYSFLQPVFISSHFDENIFRSTLVSNTLTLWKLHSSGMWHRVAWLMWFGRNFLSPGLKMDEAGCSETFVDVYQTTQHYILEDILTPTAMRTSNPILSLCSFLSFLNMRKQLSHPFIQNNFYFNLYSLENRQEDKRFWTLW